MLSTRFLEPGHPAESEAPLAVGYQLQSTPRYRPIDRKHNGNAYYFLSGFSPALRGYALRLGFPITQNPMARIVNRNTFTQ